MNAKGFRGFLIAKGDEGFAFRVYTDIEGGFIDYDILHHDLEIEIIGGDAVLYSKGYDNWIDYER